MTLLSWSSSTQQAAAPQSVMQFFSPELEQEIDAILAHGGPFTRGPDSVSPLVTNVRRSPPRCVAPPRWLRLHCGTCTNLHEEEQHEKLGEEPQKRKESKQQEEICNYTNTDSIENDYTDQLQRIKSKIRKRRKHVLTINTETTQCKDNVTDDAETVKTAENINYNNANVLQCDTKRSYRHINAPEHLLDGVDSPSRISSIATSLLESRATELNYQNYLQSPLESAAFNISDYSKHTPIEQSIHTDLTESMMSTPLHQCNNITRKEPTRSHVRKSYQRYAKNKRAETKSNNKNKNQQEEEEKNKYNNNSPIKTQLSHHEQYNKRVIPAPLLIWSEVCMNESTVAPEVNKHVITILMESSSNQFLSAHTCSNGLQYQSENNKGSSNIEENMSSKAIQGVLLLTLSTEEFGTYTVHDVKRAIRKRISVALPTQQLSFQGVKLCDELPIALLNTDTLVLTLQITSTSSPNNESDDDDDDVGEDSETQNVKYDAQFATMYHQHHSTNSCENKSFTDSNDSSTANSSLLSQHAPSKQQNYERANHCEQPYQRSNTISSSSLSSSSFQSSAHISEVTQDEMQGTAQSSVAATTTTQSTVTKESNKNKIYDKINSKIWHTKSQRENREKDSANYLKRALIDALPPISMLNNIVNNKKWQNEREKKVEREQEKRITSMLAEMSLSSELTSLSNVNNYNNRVNKSSNKHTSSTNNLERESVNVNRNGMTCRTAGDWERENGGRGSGGAGGVDAWSSDSTTSEDDIDDIIDEDSDSNEMDDNSKVVTNNHNRHKHKTLGIRVVENL